MGLMRWVRPEQRALEGNTLAAWAADLQYPAGANTMAGQLVTEDSMLSLAAAFACVTLRAETLATMPVDQYRKGPDNTRVTVEAPERAAWLDEPNGEQDWPEFIAMCSWSLDTDGNVFLVPIRNRAGAVVEVWVLDPATVQIRAGENRTAGAMWTRREYWVHGERFPFELVHRAMHVRPGALRGLNPVDAARETIGSGLAAQTYGSQFFGSGGMPLGVVEAPGSVTAEQAKAFRSAWLKTHGGARKSTAPALLGGGARYSPITVPPEQSQFLETRRFNAVEICSIFHVPPEFVGVGVEGSSSVVYQNLEAAWSGLIRRALLAPINALERTFSKLLPADDKIRFRPDVYMKADSSARSQMYATLIGAKVMTPNEARAFEDWEPLEGGDNFGDPAPPPEPPPSPDGSAPPAAPDANGPADGPPARGRDCGCGERRYDDTQPRDEFGRWASIGSSAAGVAQHTIGIESGKGTDADPFVTGSPRTAAELIGQGYHVELQQPEQLSTLLDEIHAIVKQAEAAHGKDAGKEAARRYDLCRASVEGTNLFCEESIAGMDRLKMPQLSGVPEPGSWADRNLEKDAKGEVNLANAFIDHLRGQGVDIVERDVPPSHLRASQTELNGGKVAGMLQALEAGTLPPGAIFTTSDQYIVDGHHRWAANVTYEMDRQGAAPITMPVREIDLPILEALKAANDFARSRGLASQGRSAPADGEARYAETQPRDEFGRFTSDGGGGVAGMAPALAEKMGTDGGFTMSRTGSFPTKGIAVGVPGHSAIMTMERFSKPAEGKAFLRDYIESNAEALASNPRLHLGGWHDSEHGEVVLDLVEVFENREEGIQAGRERGEQAVWDLAAGEEIPTGGTGGRDNIDIQRARHRAAHETVGDDDRRREGGVRRRPVRPDHGREEARARRLTDYLVELRYSEDQPRDEQGRWTGGGGDTATATTDGAGAPAPGAGTVMPSRAFDVRDRWLTPQSQQDIKQVLAGLDGIVGMPHGDGIDAFGSLAIRGVPSGTGTGYLPFSTLGQFAVNAEGAEIRLNADWSQEHATTLLHEIGHRIDYGIDPTTNEPVSHMEGHLNDDYQTNAAMGFLEAAMNTPEYQAIEAGQREQIRESINSIMGSLGDEIDVPSVIFATEREKIEGYFSTPREVWARAFAQYTATKLADTNPAVAKAMQTPGWRKTQWPADHFALTIAPAVENVLRERGLLQ